MLVSTSLCVRAAGLREGGSILFCWGLALVCLLAESCCTRVLFMRCSSFAFAFPSRLACELGLLFPPEASIVGVCADSRSLRYGASLPSSPLTGGVNASSPRLLPELRLPGIWLAGCCRCDAADPRETEAALALRRSPGRDLG